MPILDDRLLLARLFRSLSARLTWAISLLVLLSLCALSFSGLSYFEKEFKKTISSQQFAMISAMANEIDSKLSTAQRILIAMGNSFPAEVFSSPQLAQQALDQERDIKEIFGQGLYLFSPTGELLATSPPLSHLLQLHHQEQEYLRRTLEEDRPVISAPFSAHPEQSIPLVMLTSPVRRSDGKLLGIFAGGIDLLGDNFLGRLSGIKVGETGYLYLYDQQRTILVHPVTSRILQRDVPLGANRLFDLALEGFEGTDYTVNSRGLQALASFKHLQFADWILAANYPVAEAYAPISQARRFFWGVLALAGTASLLITWLLTRQLTSPLHEFTERVRAVTRGETQQLALPRPTIGELATLAEAFNQLLNELGVQTRAASQLQSFSENLLDGSALPCFVLDTEHRVLLWNRACEELTGITASDMVGSDAHWRAFYDHPRPCLADFIIDDRLDPAEFYPNYAPSSLNPEGLRAEGWYPDLNGRDRYILFNAAPIRNQQGELQAVIENIEDITELRHSHDEINRALSLLSATLEATADGLLVENRQGRIVRFNHRAASMWKLTEQLELAQDLHTLTPELLKQLRDPDGYLARLQEIYRHPAGESFDTLEFHDGRVFERHSKPQDLDGEIVGRVWSFHDITDRKKLETRLRQAQKMEAVGQLAGGVAHDFNNLLTIINGYGSLLVEQLTIGSEGRKEAELILQAGERAAELTSQLLAFSRRQLLQPQVVDLNSLVRNNEKLLRHLLREDMELHCSLSADLGLVKADPRQIEQILINLVVNARDAMAQGGRVSIATINCLLDDEFVRHHPGSTGGRYAAISVQDTGCGMSEEVIERIFEPFFTTKEKGQGTGLGLATVYGIVKQSGGYITADSIPGAGSTFRIYLPLTAESLLEKPDSREPLRMGSGRILVVEDEEEVLELVVSALRSFGYTVSGAESPNRALQLFRQSAAPFDLLLTDMIMPGLSGTQLAQLLQDEQPTLKVLYMSGYGEHHLGQHQDEDAPPLLSKPFTPDVLISQVRERLSETG